MDPRRLFAPENLLNWLLVFVPVAAGLEWTADKAHPRHVAIFVTACLAIIPLAGWMGKATEHLAERTGEGIGGLLNATFGNMAELIIAVIALAKGHQEVVKASITGSIIGNVLLVFGVSALAGGLKFQTQSFNRTAAGTGTTLLALSAVALVVPSLFDTLSGKERAFQKMELSFEISVVLIATYALSLLFVLKSHSHLYSGGTDPHAEEKGEAAHGWSVGKSVGVLVTATAGVAWMAHMLVGSIEGVAEHAGLNSVFIGVVLVAIVGNAAEHSTAVLVAMKNKMDLAMNIAVGSSIQVALFVAPVLVFASYVVGETPMDLLFTRMEVLAVAVSVGLIALIAQDGETNWLEGAMMLAVYLILGLAFLFLPVAVH